MLRILTPAAGLLLAAALLAGCGGSNNNGSGGSTTPSSSGSTRVSSSAGLRMAQCMRSHGVPSFPDQPSSGDSPIGIQGGSNGTATINGVTVPQATLQAAFQKCRNELPHGPPLTAAQIAQIRRGALRMAQCMRANGVPNFPDPQVSAAPDGHGIGIRIGIAGGGSNQGGSDAQKQNLSQSPAFKAAQQKCMPIAQEAVHKAFGSVKGSAQP
jgi:hypothetical protein